MVTNNISPKPSPEPSPEPSPDTSLNTSPDNSVAHSELIREHVAINNCEREAIHIPGMIQPHGVLFCLDVDTLTIVQVSENSEEKLGYKVTELIGKSLSQLLTSDDFKFIQSISQLSTDEFPVRKILKLATLTGRLEPWIAQIHVVEKLLIVEIERINRVKTEADFVNTLERSVNLIQDSRSLRDLCVTGAAEMQKLTGYDRVMIYRFDPEWNGEVLAESSSGSHVDSYLNHRFPASDIPSQARAVFLTNWLRMIPDAHYEPVKITPTLTPTLSSSRSPSLSQSPTSEVGKPLDLSRSYLRSVSPVHLQYLRNMGVSATLTVSLISNGKLWGLIACHHSSPKLMNSNSRSACQFLGRLISAQIVVQELAEISREKERLKLVHDVLFDSMNRFSDISQGLAEVSGDFLSLTASLGAAVILSDSRPILVGATPDISQVQALCDWLSVQTRASGEEVFYTDCLSKIYRESYPYAEVASGVLAVAIPRTERSFIIWFRPQVLQTITWAGQPQKNVEKMTDGTLKIEPRSSFESWKEILKARSMPWKSFELEAALTLRTTIIGIDLKRQFRSEQIARAKFESLSREKDDLLAIVSHDLKTPLQTVDLSLQLFERKYRGRAQLDENMKLIFADIDFAHAKIASSSKIMQRLIHDLLDVAKIESGTFALNPAVTSVTQLIERVVELIQPLADEKSVALNIFMPEHDISMTLDEHRVFQVLTNLLGNALKFTPVGGQISLGLQPIRDALRVVIEDSGIGIPPEHLPHIFDRFWQVARGGRLGSGLGLAICKGIVESHKGKIWVESQVGIGTTVYFTLPAFPA